MKTAIIFSDGIKQIVFTPENDQEKQALNLITVDDKIELALHEGTMFDQKIKPFHGNINQCQGGYLRCFSDEKSIMLVLKPKSENERTAKTFSLENLMAAFEQARLTNLKGKFKHNTVEDYIKYINGQN